MLSKKEKKEKAIYDREYRKNNVEKIRRIRRTYYAKHREKILENQRIKRLTPDEQKRRSIYWQKYHLANKEQLCIKGKKHYKKNKQFILNRTARKEQEQREAIFKLEGNKCVCCGMGDPMYFQIDHVYNDGAESASGIKRTRVTLTKYLATPERYQLLCCNCNWAKQLNGGKIYKPKKQKKVA